MLCGEGPVRGKPWSQQMPNRQDTYSKINFLLFLSLFSCENIPLVVGGIGLHLSQKPSSTTRSVPKLLPTPMFPSQTELAFYWRATIQPSTGSSDVLRFLCLCFFPQLSSLLYILYHLSKLIFKSFLSSLGAYLLRIFFLRKAVPDQLSGFHSGCGIRLFCCFLQKLSLQTQMKQKHLSAWRTVCILQLTGTVQLFCPLLKILETLILHIKALATSPQISLLSVCQEFE